MAADVAALPFIDEHHVLVSASTDDVWRHMGAAIRQPRLFSHVAAYLLGAVPRRANGDPLTSGAALPGFTVRDAVSGDHLVLAGRHRFSEYALIVTLAGWPSGTRLSARTYARFPGLRGRLYRTLVLSSGAHRLLLTRLLRTVRRAAEADASTGP